VLGKWSSEASYHVRPGGWLRSTCDFGLFDEVCNGDLTITLMLLELCECCFTGTAPLDDPEWR
jgi:hypothetical protein